MLFSAIFVGFSYLVGAIPTGYLLARYLFGIDIRKFGSGNIGATNMNRVFGKKIGVLTLILDGGKSFAVILIGKYLQFSSETLAIGAFFMTMGNCFSIFLGGKGGKGVATTFGIFLGLSPQIFLIGALLYAGMTALTRISAAGSLSVCVFLPIGSYFWIPDYFFLSGVLSALVIVRHHENIAKMYDKICKKCNL